jgi:hypothetical protein
MGLGTGAMSGRRWLLGGLAVAVAVVSMQAAPAATRSGLPGFGRPVVLPGGAGHSEPSMVIDSAGRIYVSPIAGLPTSTPVWRSVDAGRSFTEQPSCSVGPEAAPLGGGDSALVLDKYDNLYGTDLWVGDDSIWYSTDHANSCTGFPFSHRIIADRNWLAYSAKDDAIYQVYDGLDALWISRADLGTPAGPAAALSFAFSNRIAPDDRTGAAAALGAPVYVRDRDGIGTPGGIAVDQRTGVVYTSWSDQGGVAVARSADKGVTWTVSHVTGSSVTGSGRDCHWNGTPITVDASGHLFIAWGQAAGADPTNPTGVSLWVAESADGGVHWHKLRIGTQTTAVFPTLTRIGVDRIAVGWVETAQAGNPNVAGFATASWRLRYGEVVGLAAGRPRVAETTVEPVVHTGTLFVGPQGGDRGMGDFFSMAANSHGEVFVAYTRGEDKNNSTKAVVAKLPAHPAP